MKGKGREEMSFLRLGGKGGEGDGGIPFPSRPTVSFPPKLGENLGMREEDYVWFFFFLLWDTLM